jgi:adenosylcobinamide kinase/adenosylcobinamide-phosphate guanylyltransferase
VNRPPFILVGGGARSGKSRFALERALSLGAAPVFVATAEPSDDEMRARIVRHREERAERLRTVEAPLELPAVIDDLAMGDSGDVVLVDCLTLWLSNLLVRGARPDEALARVADLAAALARRRVPIVVVTNEVGMGLVPDTPLGRAFRDVAGLAHQRLAREADELHLAALGVVVRLRPGPLVVHEGRP